jgi:hypothetical protein
MRTIYRNSSELGQGDRSDGRGVDGDRRRQGEVRAASTYVTEAALRVISVAFQAAGGGALFDANGRH